jgi:hypothetical protein
MHVETEKEENWSITEVQKEKDRNRSSLAARHYLKAN